MHVKVSREALGAACSECDTAPRLLAPTHFAKVDQGISPVVDYLHIDLTDVLVIRSVNTAESLGASHGGEERGINYIISVVLRG